MATKLDKEFVNRIRKEGAFATGFETLVNEVERLESLQEKKDFALTNLMTAYERLIRSNCTAAQLEAKPWECAEYCAARNALAGIV